MRILVQPTTTGCDDDDDDDDEDHTGADADLLAVWMFEKAKGGGLSLGPQSTAYSNRKTQVYLLADRGNLYVGSSQPQYRYGVGVYR